MTISIKSSSEINAMRISGALASEVLDFITPHVKPGVTTDHLNKLCHDFMVNEQKTVPAPLNYCPPGYKDCYSGYKEGGGVGYMEHLLT